MTRFRTLTQVAKELNISVSKASQIKRIIEIRTGAPAHMVWGTGNFKNYTLSAFKKVLEENK